MTEKLKQCYTCNNFEELDKPKMFTDYSIYGYCHKDEGNYPVYIPEGGVCCKSYKTRDMEEQNESNKNNN